MKRVRRTRAIRDHTLDMLLSLITSTHINNPRALNIFKIPSIQQSLSLLKMSMERFLRNLSSSKNSYQKTGIKVNKGYKPMFQNQEICNMLF
jgi:hypothetical protein